MGQLARQRVFQSRGPKANDRLILLALADATPDDRYTCYPSVQTLADMAGMSDRQAQRVIAGLERSIPRHLYPALGGGDPFENGRTLLGVLDQNLHQMLLERARNLHHCQMHLHLP